jgi:hypothetical protein
MDSLPLPRELEHIIYKFSCKDAFDSLPIAAWNMKIRRFQKCETYPFIVAKYQHIDEFTYHFNMMRQFVTVVDHTENDFLYFCMCQLFVLNKKFRLRPGFQMHVRRLLRLMNDRAPFLPILKDLRRLVTDFMTVQHLEPMPLQGTLNDSRSALIEAFGYPNIWNEWFIVFHDGTEVYIHVQNVYGFTSQSFDKIKSKLAL